MKCKTSTKILLGICLAMLLVNVLARLCHPAADWYIARVFPYLSAFWCRISGIFPFSAGEWLIVAGIVLLGLTLIGIPLILIFAKGRRLRIMKIIGKGYVWLLTWLLTVTTMHFLVLYQGTPLSRQIGEVSYENAEVLRIYRQLTEAANAESERVQRDADGYAVLSCDLMTEAKACMQRLSQEYPQYRGYYPNAKPIYHAYFFSQQNLLGIYYPFTMEANYNPVVYEVNIPVTVCHEFTHLKGNIFEDEAGYYAYLACMTSDCADFRYSAYVSALEWMNLDFGDDEAAWKELAEINAMRSPGLSRDLYAFVPEEYWETHKETDEIVPTALVTETAEQIMDTSLKVNGVSEGTAAYSGMTALLLHYYLDNE